MRENRKYFVVLTAVLFTFSTLSALEVLRVPANKRIAKGDSPKPELVVDQQKEGVDFPSVWNWKQIVARTNANYQYNGTKNYSDQWWFETVQPFYVTKESLSSTVFTQFRAMFQGNIKTFDIGLSYRNLFYKDRYILGVNGFYDTRYRYGIQRWSVGGDLHSQWLTVSGNYYGEIGGWRKVSTTTNTVKWERALSGGDLTATAPFPYMPWLRIQAGFYNWDYVEGSSDATGYTIAAKANIWGPLFVDGGRESDRYRSNNFVRVSLNFGFPNFMQYTLVNTPISKKVLPARTLKRFILDPIKRYNHIRVQIKTTTSSSGIIIGRA